MNFLKGIKMIFSKKNSRKSIELVGGDMDGIKTTVKEALPELEFNNQVYPSEHDLSGNLNEAKIKETKKKKKPIKTIRIIYKKWKTKESKTLYRFDRYEK